jgi:hypothetical protein
MSTRLFTYGNVKTVPKQNEWLPGVFASAWGINLNAPATKASDLAIEYGEIVQLNTVGMAGNASYKVVRVSASSTKFGVIIRTTDGQIGMEDEWLERPRAAQTLSVYPLSSPNSFKVAVIVEAGETPVVGEQVYVSYDTGEEGSVRITAGSTVGIALTGWTFATAKYKPTKGVGYAVVIQRTV